MCYTDGMREAGRWKPYMRGQGQVLPAYVDDALYPSDPVFFINDAVEQLQIGPLEACNLRRVFALRRAPA
jgi:hypothetical protein